MDNSEVTPPSDECSKTREHKRQQECKSEIAENSPPSKKFNSMMASKWGRLDGIYSFEHELTKFPQESMSSQVITLKLWSLVINIITRLPPLPFCRMIEKASTSSPNSLPCFSKVLQWGKFEIEFAVK
jgi:hypothetical protein